MTIFAAGTTGFVCRAQQNIVASSHVHDKYSMSPYSRFKPEMQYFLVRLKGDKGVSIIDLNGNIISRNFAPVTNSKGEVYHSNWTTPVIDDVFCICRTKMINDYRSVSESTIYHNASHPTPVAGLTGLYSANIINPNLFPISRHGERIKFVDSKGNVKFTVMPIDGKEPRSVSPVISNGIIEVEVEYDVETNDYTDSNGIRHKAIIKSTVKYGAIDTNGKWVIYPEYDEWFDIGEDGSLYGRKGGELYKINPATGQAVRDINRENLKNKHGWIGGGYLVETFWKNELPMSNIYDLKQNYITTLDNADLIRPNFLYPGILIVRRNYGTKAEEYENLVDLSKNNAVISKDYYRMEELPDGNYLGRSRKDNRDVYKCWYVKYDGTATPLPDNCEYPLRHPLMNLYYKPVIDRVIVHGIEGAPSYICDFNGNKVGNILIEEYYHDEWEAEPVESSYWRKHILGEDDN